MSFSNPRKIALDPNWGNSSAFGICVTELRDSKIVVLEAEEIKNTTNEEMLDYVLSLYHKYAPVSKIYVDNSQISYIKSLKGAIGEEVDYIAARQRYKLLKTNPSYYWTVEPVIFTTSEKKSMTSNARGIMERHWLAIHPKFDKLLNAMVQVTDHEGIIENKSSLAGNDVLDAFFMCLRGYE